MIYIMSGYEKIDFMTFFDVRALKWLQNGPEPQKNYLDKSMCFLMYNITSLLCMSYYFLCPMNSYIFMGTMTLRKLYKEILISVCVGHLYGHWTLG